MPQYDSFPIKAKVCMVGDRDSGKTQLIRPFVLENFDDRYTQTLGTNVFKKELEVPNPSDGEGLFKMTVWDIFGSKGFPQLLKDAYFYGSRGILGVCDISRKGSLEELSFWINGVFGVTGPIPVVLAINRKQASDPAEITESDAESFAAAYEAEYFWTYTKTGKNVEEAFSTLAVRIVQSRVHRRSKLAHEQ
jgi:small GTP-binding protein